MSRLMFLCFNVAIFSMVTLPASAADSFTPTEKRCFKVQEQIDKIDSKLRAGVSANTGETLKDRLRTYKYRRYQCQKERFKTE